MAERLFALLVDDHSETFQSLRRILRDLSVETYSVESCKDAENLISHCKPQMIFTNSSVADGSWMNILRMADQANAPLSVIVVAEHPDTKLYVSVMERGAFDFVAPPFEREPLSFVTLSAALATHRRREAVMDAA